MRLIRWEQEHGSERVDDYGFFEQPLDEPVLFQFRTRRMNVKPHAGGYSLKFTLAGREIYSFGARRLSLVPGELLLVERGRTYGSEIAADTRSLSIFFPDDWVTETAASLRQDRVGALDNPEAAMPQFVPVVPLSLSAEGNCRLALLAEAEHAAAEEPAILLLAEALGLASSINLMRERLSGKRAATRDELLTRLRRAHDRIVDQNGLGVDLDGLSRTACLSRFHFLRLFKQVYGRTPLRFAAEIRMGRAAALSAAGDIDAAVSAGGFRSKAAFRRALRRPGPVR